MFSFVLSAAILTTTFADDIDFTGCIRSPETSVNVTDKSTMKEIKKRLPRDAYTPEVNDFVTSYMKYTPPMYVFMKLSRDYRPGYSDYQYGAVNNGTTTKMVNDYAGNMYKMGLEKCAEYSSATRNNDEPPYDESTGNPESKIPPNIRRKRFVDL
ncbi:hypothetical protein Q1695_015928 [Nippostrongylus brasiliensis]|nr:hypothetical protein Q1695_015928 [Nippostrongylus brasiliensis]